MSNQELSHLKPNHIKLKRNLYILKSYLTKFDWKARLYREKCWEFNIFFLGTIGNLILSKQDQHNAKKRK